jgi:hypothetical protein
VDIKSPRKPALPVARFGLRTLREHGAGGRGHHDEYDEYDEFLCTDAKTVAVG